MAWNACALFSFLNCGIVCAVVALAPSRRPFIVRSVRTATVPKIPRDAYTETFERFYGSLSISVQLLYAFLFTFENPDSSKFCFPHVSKSMLGEPHQPNPAWRYYRILLVTLLLSLDPFSRKTIKNAQINK